MAALDIPLFGCHEGRRWGQSLHIVVADHLSRREVLQQRLQILLLGVNHESTVLGGIGEAPFEAGGA